MSAPSPRKRAALGLLVILPLIFGAIYLAIADASPQDAWLHSNSSTDNTPGAAAPAVGDQGIDPQQLINARRSAGTAGSQTGFLVAGTGQLAQGTQRMHDESGKLIDGTQQAVDGSQELTNGLAQLQAGTGRLANGAEQVAGGVDKMYEQVQGIVVLQTQVGTAIENAQAELRKNNSPEARDTIRRLDELKQQITTSGMGPGVADDLTRLREGAHEVARQLGQPGAPYHDGVYEAAQGSKRLTSGLRELNSGAGEAVKAINQLNDGAKRVDDMAKDTDSKVKQVQRALPATRGAGSNTAGSEENNAAGSNNAGAQAPRTLSPTIAFLIAALVMVGAAALWLWVRPQQLNLAHRVLTSPWLIATLIMTAIGTAALYALRPDTDVARIGLSVATIALAALASAMFARGAMVIGGPVVGRIIIAVTSIAQIAIVGWVWQTATAGPVDVWQQVVAGLFPLNYPTAALTAVNNEVFDGTLWAPLAVLAAMVALGNLLPATTSRTVISRHDD